MNEEDLDKLCDQTDFLFNMHLLSENKMARDMFRTYIKDAVKELEEKAWKYDDLCK